MEPITRFILSLLLWCFDMPPSHENTTWASEIEPRLKNSLLYNRFLSYNKKDGFFSHFHASLIDILHTSHHRSKIIIRILPEYTLHDSDHFFRVLSHMDNIIPADTLSSLSIVDIYVLIVSAFLHDIGLTASQREINAWRGQLTGDYLPKHSDPQRISNYAHARPDRVALIRDHADNRRPLEQTTEENNLIADFLRDTHGPRAVSIISALFSEKLQYRHVDLVPYVSSICVSHTRDTLFLTELEALVPCGDNVFFSPRFCAVILRLADLFDLDSKRAPATLFDALSIESNLSLIAWSKHRAVTAWVFRDNLLVLRADCDHPIIEDALYFFCDQIDHELLQSSTVLKTISSPLADVSQYSLLPLPRSVTRDHIQPLKKPDGSPIYTYSKTRFTLDQDKVVDLLMGTSLYGDPAVALRELLQNSIDACLVRKAFSHAWSHNYKPQIVITLDRTRDGDVLRVDDNGIGMDRHILEHYYSKVGACFYKSKEFYELMAEHHVYFETISRFGIGVLSYFLVANRVRINTRRIMSSERVKEAVDVEVDGVNGLFWLARSDRKTIGTSTNLELLANHPWRDLDDEAILVALEAVLPEPPFEIEIRIGSTRHSYIGSLPIDNVTDDVRQHRSAVLPYIRSLPLHFRSSDGGYEVQGYVAWLQHRDVISSEFTLQSSPMRVQKTGQHVNITNKIALENGFIDHLSTSFNLDGEKFNELESYYHLVEPRIDLSVHGFFVPFDPFTRTRQLRRAPLRPRCTIATPLCFRIKLNVRSPSDLSLNAARDDVLPDEKWFSLVTWLYREVIRNIKRDLADEQWDDFCKLSDFSHNDKIYLQVLDSFR